MKVVMGIMGAAALGWLTYKATENLFCTVVITSLGLLVANKD